MFCLKIISNQSRTLQLRLQLVLNSTEYQRIEITPLKREKFALSMHTREKSVSTVPNGTKSQGLADYAKLFVEIFNSPCKPVCRVSRPETSTTRTYDSWSNRNVLPDHLLDLVA